MLHERKFEHESKFSPHLPTSHPLGQKLVLDAVRVGAGDGEHCLHGGRRPKDRSRQNLIQPDCPEWVDSGVETVKHLLSTWLAVQELGIRLHDRI